MHIVKSGVESPFLDRAREESVGEPKPARSGSPLPNCIFHFNFATGSLDKKMSN
jgi:hypothetical protein